MLMVVPSAGPSGMGAVVGHPSGDQILKEYLPEPCPRVRIEGIDMIAAR